MRIVMLFLTALWCAPSLAISGENLLGGAPVDVTVGASRGVVTVFMSARCPCSNSHVENLKKIIAEYAEFKFVVVHANADETRDEAKTYFTAKALPCPIIEDVGGKLADTFGASRTPHAFIEDAKGKVVYRGGLSDSHDGVNATGWPIKTALNDLRAGRTVAKADARALGCAISRKRP